MSLRVYVAGSSREIPRVRAAHRALREAGFELAYDWTHGVEAAVARGVSEDAMPDGEAHAVATRDLAGVNAADVVWLLAPEQPTRGAWVELGVADALGSDIVVSGPRCRQSVFTRLGWLCDTYAEALAVIGRMEGGR